MISNPFNKLQFRHLPFEIVVQKLTAIKEQPHLIVEFFHALDDQAQTYIFSRISIAMSGPGWLSKEQWAILWMEGLMDFLNMDPKEVDQRVFIALVLGACPGINSYLVDPDRKKIITDYLLLNGFEHWVPVVDNAKPYKVGSIPETVAKQHKRRS